MVHGVRAADVPRAARGGEAITRVAHALDTTGRLTELSAEVLAREPRILSILRASTAPPLARDRLVGLAAVKKSLVERKEKLGALPPRMSETVLRDQLGRIAQLIARLVDRDIFPWVDQGSRPDDAAILRAATVVADRLCGAESDPIIRNEQERRQLATIAGWLEARGYVEAQPQDRASVDALQPGTFAFRLNVRVAYSDARSVNIPVDVAIKRQREPSALPILIEAKSAGDVTNTNKRRKEEAQKMAQLRHQYGAVEYVLFLCGYFDSGYLGYEAAEGIDWVWEHRIDDLEQFGI